MIKILTLYILFLMFSSSCAQTCKPVLNYNTEKISNCVYDYFRGETDSAVWYVDQILMDYSYLELKFPNEYIIKTTDSLNGELSIFFKKHLLYKYQIKNGQIDGVGYIYYPFNSTVAVQGVFKYGKLNGLAIVQNKEGVILRIMKYKKGKYKKHIFSFLTNEKKSLKKMSKGRSDNPLKGDEVIVR